MIAQKLKQDYS